jgi:Family of unknown function (DUF5662)
MEALEKVELVLAHIQNVQRYTQKLGLKLIKRGDVELGRNLIANGLQHDRSKFTGIEFDHLFYGDPLLQDVVKHHSATNTHHPEHWGGIKLMPRLFIAEMVCDWHSRSTEFGGSTHDWIVQTATKKYDFALEDEVYKTIMEFLELLLERSFTTEK